MAISENGALNELVVESYVEFTSYPSDAINSWINVKLAAPEPNDEQPTRPPIDLVAVIDRSSSMEGNKFEVTKQSLYFLVSKLSSRDRLSLVVFDRKGETIFPLTFVSPHVRDWLNVKIENICVGKWTNLCEGLITGIKILEERKTKTAAGSLLLFSDGLATYGIKNIKDIVNAMKTLNNEWGFFTFMTTKKQQSYTINTFGIGTHHDTRMLDAISKAGNGHFYYTKYPQEIYKNLTNCMGGLLSIFAQEIVVHIKTLNGAVLLEGEDFELSMGRTFGNLDITDIQCGEKRDLLFNLWLPRLTDTNEKSPRYATVEIRYRNSFTERRDFTELHIAITRKDDSINVQQSNDEVNIQKSRWNAIRAMRKAREEARQGDVGKARETLTECKSEISKSKTADGILSQWILEDIQRIIDEMKDRDSFLFSGEALLTSSLHSHTRQRSTTYDTGEYMTLTRCEALNESARFTRTKTLVN